MAFNCSQLFVSSINLFHATGFFLCPLRTSENLGAQKEVKGNK